MGRALFAFAGNDMTPLATSISINAINSFYPPSNLTNYEPQDPVKANSTTMSLLFYFTSAVTPALVAGINYNWNNASAVTFGNSLGWVTSLTNNAREFDGHCPNTWKLTTGATASSIFFLTVTGANTLVQLGKLPICTSYSAVPMMWGEGGGPDFGLDYPDNAIETFSKALKVYEKGVRQRSLSGTAINEAGRSLVQLAAMSSHGRTRPVLVVTDEDVVTSAMWMRFAETRFRYRRSSRNSSRTDIDLLEVCSGLPL